MLPPSLASSQDNSIEEDCGRDLPHCFSTRRLQLQKRVPQKTSRSVGSQVESEVPQLERNEPCEPFDCCFVFWYWQLLQPKPGRSNPLYREKSQLPEDSPASWPLAARLRDGHWSLSTKRR